MDINRTFTVTYTKELVDYAVAKYFRYQFDWRFILSIVAPGVVSGYLFIAGDRTWFFGLILACFLGSLLFVVVVYFRIRGIALEKFNRMPSQQASFTVSDTGMYAVSEYGKSEIHWNSIERVLQYPRAWIFIIAGAGYFTMPIEEVDEDMRQYILGKVTK